MLQQTTVATVGPYFDQFVARWPEVSALAAASLDDVLRLWQGLGYYARARNLHACARAVAERHGGVFPDDIARLRALPGIGGYTAAAIAAIAFDRREAAVDGNVERVVARLHAVREPLPAAKPRLEALAAALVPPLRAGDFAQAMMDLGATICTPRRPRCVLCPWRDCCAALASGLAEALPARAAQPERPERRGVAFWLVRADGAVLLRRRPEKGLLGGMVEIPSTPWRAEPWTMAEAVLAAPAAAEWAALPGTVRHGFTHFRLELAIVAATGAAEGIWCPVDRLGEHALPTLMKKVARHAISALAAKPYGRARRKRREQRQPAGDGEPDRRERAAVMRRHAEPVDRRAVLARRVADIGLPAVPRIARRQIAHDPVAGHLGDDRGRGDRKAQRVTLDDGLHRAADGRRDGPVDQRDIGADPEPGDRARHRQQGRAQDVDAVDLARARRADPDARAAAVDAAPQNPPARLALLRRQCFRVVEAVAQRLGQPPRVEDHRGGDHRPGERPPPGLVDAAHEPLAAPLDREIRHRPSRRRLWHAAADPGKPARDCDGGCAEPRYRGSMTALWPQRIAAAALALLLLAGPPALAFDLFTKHEVTAQFATPDGKPMANAEVRVFAPGEPGKAAATGRTDAAGKFVFGADRDGMWSAEARNADEVARVMIRVGGDQQSSSRLPLLLIIGALAVLAFAVGWRRLVSQARARRPKP